MGRSARSQAAESRRSRSKLKTAGRLRSDGECLSGHPAFFVAAPAFELGRMPEGGGYPTGFFELACSLMDVTDPAAVLHLCSGSVRAPLTVDLREHLRPAVVADVRWLPFRPASVRWIMADPPYSEEHAEDLWGVGKKYPTPIVLLRECAEVLAPGGQVAFLHHLVPVLPAGLDRVGTWGVHTGPGYRIRALTVARRSGVSELF